MLKRVFTLTLAMLLIALNVMGQRGDRTPPINNDPPAINLAKMCESSDGLSHQYSMCAGWMGGLMLGIDASESLKDTRSICFPSGFSPLTTQDNLRKIFAKYVKAHPDKLNVHVGHVAYQAFLEEFPCKK